MGMVILLLLFFVLLAVCYKKAQKDIMDPAVLFCAAYSVSVFCAALNIKTWDIHMQWYTILFLTAGAVLFAVVSFAVRAGVFRYDSGASVRQDGAAQKMQFFKNGKASAETGDISPIVVAVICVYTVLTILLMVRGILEIAESFGTFSSFSQALTLYKDHASYKVEAKLPQYVTLMLKPVIACAYVLAFYFQKAMLRDGMKLKQKLVRYWYYLLPPVLYVAQRLLESNRGAIIDYVIAIMVMYFILWNRKYSWKKQVAGRTLLRIAGIAVAGLIIFYYSAALIGRINTKGIWDYITYYCGGSIECFNRYLGNRPKPSSIFGEETFYHLIVNLDSLGITHFNLQQLESGHFMFQYHNDIMIGNIYTAYRRWMQDFGVLGTVLLQSIMAAFFSGFYYLIRVRAEQGKMTDLAVIVYSYLAYCIVLHPIDSYFYLETFSKAGIAVIVMILIVYAGIRQSSVWCGRLRSRKEIMSKDE